MSKRCYYEVLGVERTVDEVTLKTAFRKKAMEHHPDRNHGDAGAETRFKEVNEAYSILSDGDKRAAYDRFGHDGVNGGGAGGFGGFGGGAGFSNVEDIFSEMFGDIFGQQQRRPGGAQRGCPVAKWQQWRIGGGVRKLTQRRNARDRLCGGRSAERQVMHHAGLRQFVSHRSR